jgi:hypothetical protein
MGSYLAAAGKANDDDLSALTLYAWNAEVSASMLSPLHICEVVIRNAVSDALEALYGPRWPWNATFERSLPTAAHGYYDPRHDLQSVRKREHTTGKVIPELKFVCWQKMFTGRYDTRIWDPHLRRVLPNLDPAKSIADLRKQTYAQLEQMRLLRNRIAHHEPIFNRSLADDHQTIHDLVAARCSVTAGWLKSYERATSVIASKPSAYSRH